MVDSKVSIACEKELETVTEVRFKRRLKLAVEIRKGITNGGRDSSPKA
jgi:hypothetical protein